MHLRPSSLESSRRSGSGCLLPALTALVGLGIAASWWDGAGGRWPAAWTAAAAEGPAPRPRSEQDRPEPSRVPFDLVASNHMVVRAKVNGQGPYRLVFDLGAPVTILGNKAGEESGVVAKGAPRSLLMGMRGEGEIQTLEVGNLTASRLPVMVLDHPTLKALGGFLGKPLDGIIGFTFFARYRTTIDYQARVLTFEPVDFAVRDLLKDLPERLAGPKVARTRVLAPAGVWGITLGAAVGAGEGVRVAKVRPDSPAATAGLRPGDIVTALDGRWTVTAADVYAAASAVIPSGSPVDLVVRRDGADTHLAIRPAVGF